MTETKPSPWQESVSFIEKKTRIEHGPGMCAIDFLAQSAKKLSGQRQPITGEIVKKRSELLDNPPENHNEEEWMKKTLKDLSDNPVYNHMVENVVFHYFNPDDIAERLMPELIELMDRGYVVGLHHIDSMEERHLARVKRAFRDERGQGFVYLQGADKTKVKLTEQELVASVSKYLKGERGRVLTSFPFLK